MRHSNLRPRGLILLIVLSMLTLFSLLAISYVVFSGQSRSANFGIARRDFHGMKGAEVIDEAMKQILRGTSGNISAVGPHSLLADLYGHSESSSNIDKSNNTNNLHNLLFQARGPGNWSSSNRFLYIPLTFTPFASSRGVNVNTQMAPEDDAFTGRVLTFLDGPLKNISFRIVRSVAVVASAPTLNHSIVIDLDEAGAEAAGYGPEELCERGFEMWINARELNGLGFGIPFNFDGQTVPTSPSGTPLNLLPGFHPTWALGGQVGANNLRALSLGGAAPSDSDEAYDAPDHNDFYLAHASIPDPTLPPGLPGQDIIPSFHRAALVNYIINREGDLTDTSAPAFTQLKFLSMLDDIRGACGRPLGISVINLDDGLPNYYSANPFFDGSNLGSAISTPVLNIDLRGRWSNWTSGTPSPHEAFLTWARWLTGGPWDVDNDGDGVNDSVWVDLDLPLITSAEGKLLKMMTAYYVEDLDNRLDLNAVGNLAQTTGDDFIANPSRMANPFNQNNYTLPAIDLPQGFGLGPTESTLRHLFGSGTDLNANLAWKRFLDYRYGGDEISFANGVKNMPGSGPVTNPPSPTFDDFRSRLDGGAEVIGLPNNPGTRSRRQFVRHAQLPGLPSAPRGDYAMGFDRLGNPLMLRGRLAPPPDQGLDDPYESRLMSTPHQDLPFTIAEWERVYRHRDWDRSSYPRRLEFTPIVNHISAVTPRSSHTRHVPLAATSPTVAQITTFRELLDAIYQFRAKASAPPPLPEINADAYEQLFPLEFKRGLAMDLNRPFGNGIDDNNNGSIDEPREMLSGYLFSGTSPNINVNFNVLQKSPYIVGNDVLRTPLSEFPVLASPSLTPPSENPKYHGYRYGNVDPDYENIVQLGLAGDTAKQDVANAHHGQQSRQLLARHLYCLAMLLLPDPLVRPGITATGAAGATDEERARIIAQWAVNIIDFRDADHAMTRFAYDPFPFDNSSPYWRPNRTTTNSPAGYVVWGMEQPELLLTETGATHDLRIKDTAEDNGSPPTKVDPMDQNADKDYDQYRIPQGSLFLEFMCPRTTKIQNDNSLQVDNIPSVADSLYFSPVIGERKLNLGAVTPIYPGMNRYPVWRVAISTPHPYEESETTTPTPNNIVNGMAQMAGTTIPKHDISYQLSADATEANLNGLSYDRPQGGRTSVPTQPIDRLLWFVNPDDPNIVPAINIAEAAVGLSQPDGSGGWEPMPNDVRREAHVYFNKPTNPIPLLAGGQYLVVGPRPVTYFGSKNPRVTPDYNEPNDHRIDIDIQPNWAQLYIAPNTPVNRPNDLRDIVKMTAVTTPPWRHRLDPWDENTTTEPAPWVGLNVSEPHPTSTGYYAEPTHQLNSDDNTGDLVNLAEGFESLPYDAYFDYKAGNTDPPSNPTTPFDHTDGTPIKDYYYPLHPVQPAGPPVTPPSGVADPGTQLDWCTAFLQRLADPERPYHDTFNPYITVDWMPIDLTVFSGEDIVYSDIATKTEFDAEYKFGFRSKNGAMDSNIVANRGRTFLSYFTDAPIDSTVRTGTGVYFTKVLPVDNLDNTVPPPQSLRPAIGNLSPPNFTTLGYLNTSFPMISDPPLAPVNLPGRTFLGAPKTPPANLQWNNRDFASPYELMLVPMSAPGQLMQEFSSPKSAGDVVNVDPYSGATIGNVFAHLPNFFQQADNTAGNALPHSFTAATLLELVTVPSPWSDADKVIPPGSFNIDLSTPAGVREGIILGPLQPPYNRISQMREPGRVNINTLEEPEVLRGLEWSYLNTSDRNDYNNDPNLPYVPVTIRDLMGNLKMSRNKAYPNGVGTEQITAPNNTRLNGNYPTEFPGVFKSALAVGRVAPTTGMLDSRAILSPANATIFRESPVAGTNRPLFGARDDLLRGVPLPNPATDFLPFSALGGVPNPQTEYLRMSRLANLTTTRSNVFAVRITVGYFEYDPSTGVGPEYGWDNGQSRRHRGFYVIDRSIPVAYEPGQDLDTGNCVLVRRIVE